MKSYDWNPEKNQILQTERRINFENVVWAIENGFLLAVIESPNQRQHAGQLSFVVVIDNYAYLVPFIEQNDHIFLKTIVPSRKATKKYLGGTDHG